MPAPGGNPSPSPGGSRAYNSEECRGPGDEDKPKDYQRIGDQCGLVDHVQTPTMGNSIIYAPDSFAA